MVVVDSKRGNESAELRAEQPDNAAEPKYK